MLAVGAALSAPSASPPTLHGRIVFEAIRTFRPAGLVVMAADGSHRRPIPDARNPGGAVATRGEYAYDDDAGHAVVVDAAGTHDLGSGLASGFSPDGRTVVVAKFDDSWVLRDVATGATKGAFPATLHFHGWSPSGLLFSEGQDLVVVQADGSGERTVAHGTVGGSSPWSPDGAWIAYRTAGDSALSPEVRVVRPDGSDDHALGAVSTATDIVWSPTGTQVAFASPEADLVFAAPSGPTTNTRVGVPPTLFDLGSWSPDGSRFACEELTSSRQTRGPLVVVSAATGTAHVVSRAGGPAAWSPDGTQLLLDLGDGIAVLPATASNARPRLLVRDVQNPMWLSDGRLITYENKETDEQVATVAPAGGRVRYIPGTRGEFEPAPSPDGTKLAFASRSEATDRFTISVANADGSHRRVLAHSHAILPSPSWSPDGRLIAFATADAIDVIPSSGGRPRRVTGAELPWTVAWSPDGKQIAFGSTPNDSDFADIVLVRPDGTDRRIVVRGHAGLNWGGVAWSPDGRTIAVSRRSDAGGDPDGNADLYLVDVRTHREREIGLSMSDASFSPDGKRLTVDETGNIEIVDRVEPGHFRLIALGSRPAWSR